MGLITINQIKVRIYEKPFRKLTNNDRDWVDALCKEDGGTGAHIHFDQMLLCQEMYPYDSARKLCDCLVKKPWMEHNKLYCQYPIGSPANRKLAVQKIMKMYKSQTREIVFFGLSDATLQELTELYNDQIVDVMNDRDSQEYILDVNEFLKMEGSEYSNLRTKIRRFNRNVAWTFEEITKDNIQGCIDLSEKWYQEHTDDKTAVAEQKATNYMFDHFFELDYKGGLFRIDGTVAAFSVGIPFNDAFFVNLIRKADPSYRDSTMSMVYEFMKVFCSEFQYVNDSCDMGLPGLRKFKELLKPKYMNPFYFVTVSTK